MTTAKGVFFQLRQAEFAIIIFPVSGGFCQFAKMPGNLTLKESQRLSIVNCWLERSCSDLTMKLPSV